MAARLASAGAIHLTEDEAYYRLWASAPALGYYDHPPMIAWWIWLGERVVGDTPTGVRLLPILASALGSFLVFDFARLSGLGAATSQRAAIWWNATLLAGGGGILAVPDSPATLFWMLCLWSTAHARKQGIAWWLAVGIAAGLACLSKYSAIFLGPGVLLWWLADGSARRELAKPGPWIAAALALALFGLNVAWNAEHHWLTFDKQFGRITQGAMDLRHVPEFLVGQFLLLNPFVAIFLGRAMVRREGRTKLAPFILTSAPFALYLVVHSLHSSVQGHWPAPIYPALATAAAIAAEGASGVWRGLSRAAPIFGVALAGAALAWLVASPRGDWTRADPAAPLRGWSAFAATLETRRAAAGAAWLGALSYGVTAELSDQPEIKAPVIEIVDRQRYAGLALDPPADLARPGLVVDLPRRIDAVRLDACFASVRPLGQVERSGQAYAVFVVAKPRLDVIGQGC